MSQNEFLKYIHIVICHEIIFFKCIRIIIRHENIFKKITYASSYAIKWISKCICIIIFIKRNFLTEKKWKKKKGNEIWMKWNERNEWIDKYFYVFNECNGHIKRELREKERDKREKTLHLGFLSAQCRLCRCTATGCHCQRHPRVRSDSLKPSIFDVWAIERS